MSLRDPRDYLPDIRDGLTQRERIVLQYFNATTSFPAVRLFLLFQVYRGASLDVYNKIRA